MRLPLRPLAALAAVAVVGGGLALAAPAAATGWPGAPANVHVTANTATSFPVTATRATNASRSRLWSSTAGSDLYYPNLKEPNSRRHVTTLAPPTVTSGGWTYQTGTIYYRYATVNGAN